MERETELKRREEGENEDTGFWEPNKFKQQFSHFEQYYTLFHSYIFQKTPNNNSQTNLPNTPEIYI